jgi:hypothetical protein
MQPILARSMGRNEELRTPPSWMASRPPKLLKISYR